MAFSTTSLDNVLKDVSQSKFVCEVVDKKCTRGLKLKVSVSFHSFYFFN